MDLTAYCDYVYKAMKNTELLVIITVFLIISLCEEVMDSWNRLQRACLDGLI